MKNARHVLGAAIAAVLVSGCNDSGGSAGATSYQGAGSRWDATFRSDGSCTISESTENATLNCNHADLASGLKKITFTSVSGASGPRAGDVTYGLEVPGYAMVVHPDDELIPMVAAGECPTPANEGRKANSVYIEVERESGVDFSTASLFGQIELNNIAGNASSSTLDTKLYQNEQTGALTEPPQAPSGLTCQLGAVENFADASGGGGNPVTVDAYLTATGGLIVRVELPQVSGATDSERVFALPTGNGLTNIAAANGDYIGLVFKGGDGTGHEVMYVAASAVNGTWTLNEIDPETGAKKAGGMTGDQFSLTSNAKDAQNAPIDSLWTGTLTVGPSTNIGCAIDANANNTGKLFMACSGVEPGSANKRLYGAILLAR